MLFSGNEFSPLQVSGLTAWLDANSLSLADNASVSSWPDKSGNVAPFGQATTAQQPIFKTGIQNSKPVVRFDGVDDNLIITAPLSTNLLGSVNGVSFSPDSVYMAVAISVSPYVQIYKRSGNYFELLANPGTLPPNVARDCKFSPNGNYLTVVHSSTPFVTIYKRSGDTFTKLSNPATLPAANSYSVAWSHDSSLMAVAHATSPYITIYSVNTSTDTFTKEANPTDLPTGTCNGVSFDNTKTYLTVAVNSSPYLLTYKITAGPTFTKLTDPATLPTGPANDVQFSPNGNYLAFSHSVSPFLTVYSRSGDTFTKLSDPATLPGGTGNGVSWSTNSDYITVAHSIGVMTIYNLASNTLTKITTISSQPTGTVGNRSSYSPDGSLMAFGSSSGQYLTVYSKSGGTFTNLSRLDMFRNVSGATLFIVKKNTNYSNTANIFLASTTTATSSRILVQTATTPINSFGGRRLDADAFASVTDSPSATTNFQIFNGVIDYANSDIYMYVNNALRGSSTSFQTNGNSSDTNSASIGFSVGLATYFTGDIGEVLLFNRKLDATEISNIYNYLSVKWGI